MYGMLLALDPGACTGWAFFTDTGQLQSCGLDNPPYVGPTTRVVIERPHPHKTRAPVRDIITLAVRAGQLGGRYLSQGCQIEYVEPGTWMGGAVKPDINQARIEAALTDADRRVVPHEGPRRLGGIPKSDRHNLIDAIGIGLWALRSVRGPK